jgi:hypothetical protein
MGAMNSVGDPGDELTSAEWQDLHRLALVFRLVLMNTAVIIGALAAVLGPLLAALDTDELMERLDLPPSLADFLSYRLARG